MNYKCNIIFENIVYFCKKNTILRFFVIFYKKFYMKNSVNIALFASGNGSNAENIFNYFKEKENINIKILFCNNENAFVINRCKNMGLDCFLFNKQSFSTSVLEKLISEKIDYIVLAGFLWLVPENIIDAFPSRIINIHPALLPKYGGKGMYGDNVHKAVFAAKDNQSGITIHLVDKVYDKGTIVFQKAVPIYESDSADDIANKVHKLEYTYFPSVIEKIVSSKNY